MLIALYPNTENELIIEPTGDDIIEYLWEKEFDYKYHFDITSYMLIPQGKEVYNKFRDKWIHNKVDELLLLFDDEHFKTFLFERYKYLLEEPPFRSYRHLDEDELEEILADNYN